MKLFLSKILRFFKWYSWADELETSYLMYSRAYVWRCYRRMGGGVFETPKLKFLAAKKFLEEDGTKKFMYVDHAHKFLFYRED